MFNRSTPYFNPGLGGFEFEWENQKVMTGLKYVWVKRNKSNTLLCYTCYGISEA